MSDSDKIDPATAAHRPRVLVIDDEPVMQRLISRTLSGCDVVMLSDASEALARMAGGERFDLVLCDLNMRGMNGMQFHRQLTHSDPGTAQRVLFVTGGALGADLQEFLTSVAGRVVQKPFDVKQLRSVVGDFLSAAPRLPAA